MSIYKKDIPSVMDIPDRSEYRIAIMRIMEKVSKKANSDL